MSTVTLQDNTTIRPVEDRVIILPDKSERRERGIIIPENVRQKIQTGFVVAAGPGKFANNGARIDHGIQQGDRVWFKEYAGAEIHLDGVEHYVLRAEEVLAREPLSE